MTFSRRGFFASAMVASATISLPAMAAPIPAPPFVSPPPGMFVSDVMGFQITKILSNPAYEPYKTMSPFDIARAYAAEPVSVQPSYLRKAVPFEPGELQEFDSFRDLLLSAFEVREITPEWRTNVQPEWEKAHAEGRPCYVGDITSDARQQLRRHANLVAARSRINVAQTFLYGGPNNAFDFAIDEYVVRWNGWGTMYPTFAAFETSALTPDEVVVMHHRTNGDVFDGAFVAQMLPGGRVRAVVRENSKNFGTILRAVP
jgi:hypothetical protein